MDIIYSYSRNDTNIQFGERIIAAVSRAKFGLIILYPDKIEVQKQLQTAFKK